MIAGYILASLSVFFWGITFVSTKTLLQDFSALEILFIRFVLAYFALWAMRPKWEKIKLKDNIYFALAGLTGVVLYQFSENIAINFTAASNVSVIVSIAPLFTAICTQLFLKEKHISFWYILGFVVSIAGICLVSFSSSENIQFNPKGDLLALASAACWGFYSVFISIINSKNYNPVATTRRVFFFAVIFMIPLIIFGLNFFSADSDYAKSFFVNLSSTENALRFSNIWNWVNLLFLGIVASGFCFSAWNKACKIVGTVKVSCWIYLIPVVTIFFAFFVLGERITVLGFLGTALTITGLFLSEKKRKQLH